MDVSIVMGRAMTSRHQLPLSGFKGINDTNGTVLLVDPDAMQRRITAIFLRRCGCYVIPVSDGQASDDQYRQAEPFDATILASRLGYLVPCPFTPFLFE